MTVTTAQPEIDRDRYGRPLCVPKNGTKPTPYTRCTTFVSAYEDTHNLTQWKIRQAAVGLSLRPDLALSIAAHRDDKAKLNAICSEALEAAQSSAGATTGTALHSLTEQMDRGQEPTGLPAVAVADLAAYAAATVDLKAVYIEQLMVFDRWKVAGTPDRVVEYQGKRYIADLKTGDITWGAGKIAAQLSMYARSEVYNLTAPRERVMHGAEVDRGLVIHLPAGSGTCEVKWIDLLAGWEIVKTCRDVREKRKIKAADLYMPLDDMAGFKATLEQKIAKGDVSDKTLHQILANVGARPLAQQVAEATTRAELELLWTSRQDEWTDELTAIAQARTANLPTAS